MTVWNAWFISGKVCDLFGMMVFGSVSLEHVYEDIYRCSLVQSRIRYFSQISLVGVVAGGRNITIDLFLSKLLCVGLHQGGSVHGQCVMILGFPPFSKYRSSRDQWEGGGEHRARGLNCSGEAGQRRVFDKSSTYYECPTILDGESQLRAREIEMPQCIGDSRTSNDIHAYITHILPLSSKSVSL